VLLSMSTFFHILKYKLLSFVKATFDRKVVTAVRGIGSIIVFGMFAVAAFALSFAITQFVVPQVGLEVFHRVVSMTLFVLFLSVNMGNIIISYSTLYKSPEVGYLFTKPVSFTQIFVLKFLDNFLYSSSTFFLLVFMALLGYGTYFHYAFYTDVAVMFFVFVPLLFLSACLGVLILMSLVKVASQFGFRRVVSGLAFMYVLIVVLFFKFSNPIHMLEGAAKLQNVSLASSGGGGGGLMSLLPNNIASNVLYYITKESPLSALGEASLLLLMTAMMFTVVLYVGRRYYYRTWLMTFEFQAKSNTLFSGRKVKLFDFRKSSHLPAQWEVLAKKEFFQFFREPSQWMHLTLLLVLVFVFALSVRNLNVNLRVTEIQTIGYLILYAFAGFLSCSLALRFVFPAVSLEGKSFWTQLSAPIKLTKIYALKFTIGMVIVFFPAILTSVLANIPFVNMSERRPLLMYFGVYSTFWVTLTLVSLNLGLGGYFANYQERNPIRVASSQGATLTFLVSLVYLITLVSIVIIPLQDYFRSLFQFFPFDMSVIVAPGTTLAMLSAGLSAFALAVGYRSLQRDF
jgi:ABC-2 type transport system permease protein